MLFDVALLDRQRGRGVHLLAHDAQLTESGMVSCVWSLAACSRRGAVPADRLP